jgi:predicted dinucleotide-binding enzyme
MRIAVFGMGNVGSVLDRRWAELGHAVTFCARKNRQKAASPAKKKPERPPLPFPRSRGSRA